MPKKKLPLNIDLSLYNSIDYFLAIIIEPGTGPCFAWILRFSEMVQYRLVNDYIKYELPLILQICYFSVIQTWKC